MTKTYKTQKTARAKIAPFVTGGTDVEVVTVTDARGRRYRPVLLIVTSDVNAVRAGVAAAHAGFRVDDGRG